MCHMLLTITIMMMMTMMTMKIMTTIMMMPIIRTEGEALAKEWGEDVLFFETSAKADIAVKEVMMILKC